MFDNYMVIDIDLTSHNNIELLLIEKEFAESVIREYCQLDDIFNNVINDIDTMKNTKNFALQEYVNWKIKEYEGSSMEIKITKQQYKEIGEPKFGESVNVNIFTTRLTVDK